ncbi:MAG TPA: hypothetical protein VLP30_07385 [Desulfatirhabdiaceae bacterium]|nr:hypothetical protein [Desulfatirhabdiaceae bacterium]
MKMQKQDSESRRKIGKCHCYMWRINRSDLRLYRYPDKDFGCVIGRGWPTVFQGVSRKRPIPSLLPYQNQYLKCYMIEYASGYAGAIMHQGRSF